MANERQAVHGRTDEQTKAFLNDLCHIMLKHRITVFSCGCCQSPWLTKLTHDEVANGGHAEVNENGNALQFVPFRERGHMDHSEKSDEYYGGPPDKTNYVQSDHHSPEACQ